MQAREVFKGNIGFIAIVGIVLVFLIVTAIFTAHSSLRQEAIQTQRHIASLHANTFEENFAALLHRTEQIMENIPFLSNQDIGKKRLGALFANALGDTPYIRSLSLLNTEGEIIVSSTKRNIGISLSFDNFYPKPFDDNAILRIGVPWEGRDFFNGKESLPSDSLAQDSLYFLPVLKKVYFDNEPYTMVANINPYYLLNNYFNILSPKEGKLKIYRNDGILLLSTDRNLSIGSSYHPTSKKQTSDEGSFHLLKNSQNVIEHIKESLSLPFVVQVVLDEKKALAHWDKERNKMALISGGLIVLCGILVFLLFIKYYRELLLKRDQLSYERQFRIAMEATQTGLWKWDFTNDEITWDKQCYLLLGYEPEAFAPSIEKIRNLTHPDDYENTPKNIKKKIYSDGEFLLERRMLTADRKWMWILVRGKVIEYTKDNEPLYLTGIYSNIDKQKKAEQLHLNAVAFESQEAILITDTNEKIIKINQGFTEITGYSESEVLGKTPRILKSGEQDDKFYKRMWRSLKKDGFFRGEIWNKRKNGETYAEFITITAISNEEGVITHYLANFNDITPHKMAQKHIKQLAYHDPLTKIANRRFLEKYLKKLVRASRENDCFSAVIFIDLDDFKELNDTHGHDSGDMVLVQTANRLLESTRQSDTVARFGGDEFVILLENLGFIESRSTASKLAYDICKKILTRLNEPYSLSFGEYTLGASIGYSVFCGQDKKDVATLLKEADSAMYVSKEVGKNQINCLILNE